MTEVVERTYPFSCPVCARITEYPCSLMVEGTQLTCPFCTFSLRLHGHMLAYVQKEISQSEEGGSAGPPNQR